MTSLFPQDIVELASTFLNAAKERGLKVATAESCTGGLVAASLTEIAGSSAVVDRGFVTYSNEAKMQSIGVSPDTLEDFGAVSAETARKMLQGTLDHSDADIAVATTGVAGPGGGTAAKPVGLVFVGVMHRGQDPDVARNQFEGDRNDIRLASVRKALQMLKASL